MSRDVVFDECVFPFAHTGSIEYPPPTQESVLLSLVLPLPFVPLSSANDQQMFSHTPVLHIDMFNVVLHQQGRSLDDASEAVHSSDVAAVRQY